ncbi:MAG: hypothetical protein NWS69_11030 [Pseudomonadales bacterium]|nr:hypothetical protein [Pseudomonadales bacterium]
MDHRNHAPQTLWLRSVMFRSVMFRSDMFRSVMLRSAMISKYPVRQIMCGHQYVQ